MSSTQPPDCPLLFPPGTVDDFYNRWFSQHLHAMGEPALADLERPTDAGELQAFRFLLLPTFDRPHMVRVVKNADDSAEAVMKVLDGHGGYAPGKVCTEQIKILGDATIETWARLMQSVETADFWNRPTEEPPYRDEEGELTRYMVLDGDRYVLEGICAQRYHVVHRQMPCDLGNRKEGKFGALCGHFLKAMQTRKCR